MLRLQLQLALAGALLAAGAAACGDFDGLRARDQSAVDQSGTDPTSQRDGLEDGTTGTDGGTTSDGKHVDGGSGGDASTTADSGPTPSPSHPGDVVCYRDLDKDTFVDKASAAVFNPSCPSGWLAAPANGKFDCDDNEPFAFPGSGAFWDEPSASGSGSYDYDCNGIESKDRPYVLDCGTVPAADCAQALRVTTVKGVLPNTVADITCGAAYHSYRCKLSSAGVCTINEASSVAGNVRCK